MFFVIDFTLSSDILSLAISTIFTPSVSISSVCPSYVFAFIVCFTYPLYCSVSLSAAVPSIGISFISSEISVIARVGVPADPKYTLSFDLLFRGMEVTTGGQRIHDYAQQVAKMEAKGMDPAEFDSYLMIHKHGMPPHGGLGIGLERLTAQLCGLDNVRRASLFPRDLSRLEP